MDEVQRQLLSKRSQFQKVICHWIPFVSHSQKRQTCSDRRVDQRVPGIGWHRRRLWVQRGKMREFFREIKLFDILTVVMVTHIYTCIESSSTIHQEGQFYHMYIFKNKSLKSWTSYQDLESRFHYFLPMLCWLYEILLSLSLSCSLPKMGLMRVSTSYRDVWWIQWGAAYKISWVTVHGEHTINISC
jgi:hypothetical protein